MAEVECPLAHLDVDDWAEFNDYRLLSSLQNCPDEIESKIDRRTENESANNRNISSESLANGNDTEYTLNAEDGLTKCFPRIDNARHAESEVSVETQEKSISDSEVWKQLSGGLDQVQLVNWPESHARQLRESSLNLRKAVENGNSADVLDLSDDEELQQSMDLHGLILSSECEVQPIKSADEVISEIEEMMQDEFDVEQSTTTIDGPSKTAQIIRTKLKQEMPPGTTMIECLKGMPTRDLEMLREDLEATTREYSEVLVQELALREDLDYQKELNNQFISLLLSIQRKRREFETERKKNKTAPKQKETTNTYLTTVIPYDDHQSAPDTDRLQIYIKIMTAIEEDSVTVPTLLTDYILKVLCPKT